MFQLWLCGAGIASADVRDGVQAGMLAPMLKGTTKVLHYAVAILDEAGSSAESFAEAIDDAMSAFSDSLPGSMYLCACLGALTHATEANSKVCTTVMSLVNQWGAQEAIFTTLEAVMQVRSCIIVLCLAESAFQ